MAVNHKRKKDWREEKDRLLKMSLDERCKEYKGQVELSAIPWWNKDKEENICGTDEESMQENSQMKGSLNRKVSLYRGDITLLEVDAIVNAANCSLLGGGGVDGCIHRAAGSYLLAECRSLGGCETGEAKVTCGYELPAKYVIHTVGPITRGHITESHNKDLTNCYRNSLDKLRELNLRSIAFPCISTGIYGFPNKPAAEVALRTVQEWLKTNRDVVDRIIFCVFLEVDYNHYREAMDTYFPIEKGDDDTLAQKDEEISPTPEKDDNRGQTEEPMSQTADKSESRDEEMLTQDNGNETSVDESQGTSMSQDEEPYKPEEAPTEPKDSNEENMAKEEEHQTKQEETPQVEEEDDKTQKQ
ncbi:ADP-ribose glycohydrolase MACROD2 isoform X2 [Latimeria chalumnae]|uniref:ADP-ribose glycohydrolase MACROD2 isoform X2 n=1 Tax=Latimeria chalumnae TaxID=7897 RepID=UPI00313D27C4